MEGTVDLLAVKVISPRARHGSTIEREGQHPSLNLTLVEEEWPVSRSGRFIHGELSRGTCWLGGWMDSTSRPGHVGGEVNILSLF